MIGTYEICRQLGEGGMGTVYLVYHRPTARVLAVKQMKGLKEKSLAQRFQREIALLKTIAHPHVIRCLDTGFDMKGIPFLVTEYVSGGDLEGEVARRGGRLPVQEAVAIIDGVLTGLEYLHGQSIIHRDIKPQNILLHKPFVTGARGLPVPKLADFGLAKSYARAGGLPITEPFKALGTSMFMPPEQIRDAGTVREPADLYAVGVALYYLLTGHYTFDFPTPADMRNFLQQKPDLWRQPQEALRLLMQIHCIQYPFNIILSEEPIPVQKRDPALPHQLAAVVDKAVQKDVQQRFQSAAAFRSALQQAMR
jgi:serine/threonine protein kinase